MISTIDNEYIAANAPQGHEPPLERPDVRKDYCEVMQMAACKLDDNGNEVAIMDQVVSAHKIHFIPPWLSKMTGMTEKKRAEEGIPFPKALAMLHDLVGDDERPWTFYGDYDVLKGNANEHGIELPFKHSFMRVKPRLERWGVTLADYQRLGLSEMNSGDLHKVLGIEIPETEGVGTHDAKHDVRSLAHSLYHFKLEGKLNG